MGCKPSQIKTELELPLTDVKEEKWLPVERKEIIEDSQISGTLQKQ